MFDKARAHRRKKPARERGESLPLLNTEKAGDILRSVTGRLPELRERIEPIIGKSREKLGDLYSAVAQLAATRKEAFEDYLAERKDRSRAEPRKKRSARNPAAET